MKRFISFTTRSRRLVRRDLSIAQQSSARGRRPARIPLCSRPCARIGRASTRSRTRRRPVAAGNQLGLAARAAPRRGRVARAREESRHPGGQARTAVGRLPGRGIQESVPAGACLHGRPARSVPAADHARLTAARASARRRPPTTRRSRRKCPSLAAATPSPGPTSASPRRMRWRRAIRCSRPASWPPTCSRSCAGSRPTTCGSSWRSR